MSKPVTNDHALMLHRAGYEVGDFSPQGYINVIDPIGRVLVVLRTDEQVRDFLDAKEQS